MVGEFERRAYIFFTFQNRTTARAKAASHGRTPVGNGGSPRARGGPGATDTRPDVIARIPGKGRGLTLSGI